MLLRIYCSDNGPFHCWSEINLTIDGTKYYIPKSLMTGFTMKEAGKICEAREMIVFEPRDVSINHKVWKVMQNNGVYWLNLRRDDPSR